MATARASTPKGQRWTAASDRAWDRKNGIRQGSARDNALDKKRGVAVRRAPSKQG